MIGKISLCLWFSIVVLLPVRESGNVTKIFAHGAIKCRIFERWCVYIGIRESDVIKSNRVASVGSRCSNYYYFNYEITGELHGDGFIFPNHWYEPWMFIEHTCLSYKQKTMKARRLFNISDPYLYPTNSEYIDLHWDVEATDNGEWIENIGYDGY